jgi:hypothetical protein
MVANGLILVPDQGPIPIHEVIAPVQMVKVAQYQKDLEDTRAAWQIDET